MLYRADLIKEKLAESDMTIEEFCKTTGLSNETIWRLKNGHNTTIVNLDKVAKALGLTLSDLVTDKAA